MSLETFWRVFLLFLAFVLTQGVFSWFDGFFSQTQLQVRGIKGWSFLQHTGMYIDIVLSAVVAYLASKYEFSYLSFWGMLTLVASMIVVWIMLRMYLDVSINEPDHCAHDGSTTVAGWIHAAFAGLMIWICIQAYYNLTTPMVSHTDVLIVSAMLGVLLFLGVVKLSPEWVFSDFAKKQVAMSEAGLVIVTGLRLLLV